MNDLTCGQKFDNKTIYLGIILKKETLLGLMSGHKIENKKNYPRPNLKRQLYVRMKCRAFSKRGGGGFYVRTKIRINTSINLEQSENTVCLGTNSKQ